MTAVQIDTKTLTLVAPVMSVLGAFIGFASALRSGPKRGAAVLSSLLGLIGSTLWLVAAYQDQLDHDDVEIA